MPPVASMGISGRLMEKLLPPTTGTQSGIVKPQELMAPITELTAPITALMGTFAILARPPNRFPNISHTPCQASSQFPVNTPVIKLSSPVNMPMTFSMMGAAICTALSRPLISARPVT